MYLIADIKKMRHLKEYKSVKNTIDFQSNTIYSIYIQIFYEVPIINKQSYTFTNVHLKVNTKSHQRLLDTMINDKLNYLQRFMNSGILVPLY